MLSLPALVEAATTLSTSVARPNYAYHPPSPVTVEYYGTYRFTSTAALNITRILLTKDGTEPLTDVSAARLIVDDDNMRQGTNGASKPYGRPSVDATQETTVYTGTIGATTIDFTGLVIAVSATPVFVHLEIDTTAGGAGTLGFRIAAAADITISTGTVSGTGVPWVLGTSTFRTAAVQNSNFGSNNTYSSIQEAIDRTGFVAAPVTITIANTADVYAESGPTTPIFIDSTRVWGTDNTFTFTIAGPANQWARVEGTNTIFKITGVGYVYFQRLRIKNPGSTPTNTDSGILYTATSPGGWVKNCIFTDTMGGPGFVDSTGGKVENCTLVAENVNYSFADAQLVAWSTNATGGTLRNCIMYVRGSTSTTTRKYAVGVAATAQTGFTSDYNLFYAGGDNFNWTGLWGTTTGQHLFGASSWNTASAKDVNSLGATNGGAAAPDPQMVDPFNVTDASKDFHLASEFGYWSAAGVDTVVGTDDDVFALSSESSPALDLGDPTYAYTGELEDNGNRINMGAYGGTPQASLSGVRVPGANNDNITTWTENSSVFWNNAGNWSGRTPGTGAQRVPGIGGFTSAIVYIPARSDNYYAALNVTASIAALTISNYQNDSPTISGGYLWLYSATPYTLGVAGNVTIEPSLGWAPTLRIDDNAQTLNVVGNLDIAGDWLHYAGTVNLAGNLLASGTLSDTGGMFNLNGTGAQSVGPAGASIALYSLNFTGSGTTTVTSTTSLTVGAGGSTVGGTATVNFGDTGHTFAGDYTSTGTVTASSASMYFGGDFSSGGVFSHSGGAIVFNGTRDQAVSTGAWSLKNVLVDNTSASATVSFQSYLVAAGVFSLNGTNRARVTFLDGASWAGAVSVDGGLLDLAPLAATSYTATSGITVSSGAGLRLAVPAVLFLPTAGLTVNGDLFASSSGGSRPVITTTGTAGGAAASDHYALLFQPGAATDTIDINGLVVESPDGNGLDINGGGSQIVRLDDIQFESGNYGSQSPNAFTNTYLSLRGVTSGSYTFRLLDYDQNCKHNVKLPGYVDGINDLPGTSTANVRMLNALGSKGDQDISDTPSGGGYSWSGEGRDGDPDLDTHITWQYYKRWIGSVNTMWSLGANWEGGAAPRTTAPYDDVLISPGQPYDPVLDVTQGYSDDFMILDGGSFSFGTGATRYLSITGNASQASGGSIIPGLGRVLVEGSTDQQFGLSPLWELSVRPTTNATIRLTSDVVLRDDLFLMDGILDLNGHQLTVGDPTYGSTMLVDLDTDSDGVGELRLGTGARLTSGRNITTRRCAVTMSGDAVWTADDGAGVGTITATVGAAPGGGSWRMSDTAHFVFGDGDGADTFTTGNGASFTMTATALGAPYLELAGGASPASATFGASFTARLYGTNKPGITRRAADASGYFGLTLNGTVDIVGLNLTYANSSGLYVPSASNLYNLHHIYFGAGPFVGGATLLKIGDGTSVGGGFVSEECYFGNSADPPVYVTLDDGGGGFTLTMRLAVGSGEILGDSNIGTRETELNGAAINWSAAKLWAGVHQYKRQLTVPGTPAKRQTIEITYSGATTPTAATVRARCSSSSNNYRVYYNPSGSTWVELPREVRSWTDSSVVVRCEVQANGVTASTQYWIAYGSGSAGTAPSYSSLVLYDDFESDNGWTVVDTSTTDGGWARGDPASGSAQEPADDTTPGPGVNCYATGLAAGQDHDGTRTDLRSPTIDLASYNSVNNGGTSCPITFQYDRWFNRPSNDTFEVTGAANGVSFTEVYESLATTAPAWTTTLPTGQITDASKTSNFRLQFSFINAGAAGNPEEAALDEVYLFPAVVAATFVGAGDDSAIGGLWSETLNWSPFGVPASSDDVVVDDWIVPYTEAPNVDASFAGTITNLEIQNTSPGALILNRFLTVQGDLTIGYPTGLLSGAIGNTNAQQLTVQGDWTVHAPSSFNAETGGGGTVIFTGGTARDVIRGNGTTVFQDVTVAAGAGATTVSVDPDSGGSVKIAGTLTINSAQIFEIASGKTLRVVSAGGTATAITANGTLRLKDGSTLDFEGKASPDFTTVTIASTGSLSTSGTTDSARATITSSDTSVDGDGYAFIANTASGVNLSYYNFYYPGRDGLKIVAANAIGGLSNGNFDYPSNGADAINLGVLLNFIDYNFGAGTSISGCSFQNSGGATNVANVRGGHTIIQVPAGSDSTNHATITFASTAPGTTGAFSGEAYDQDLNDIIAWPDTAGAVAPDLTAAVASDDSGAGAGIQYGDRVVITFNRPTNGLTIPTGTYLFEDFNRSDVSVGNPSSFTSDQIWTVGAGQYGVGANESVDGNTNTDDWMTTSCSQAYGTWEFKFRFSSMGSNASHQLKFYLVANVASPDCQGYFVYLTPNSDLAEGNNRIELRRRDGVSEVTIGGGGWAGDTATHTARVTRDKDSNWSLLLDGTPYGAGTDGTYTSSSYVLIRNRNADGTGGEPNWGSPSPMNDIVRVDDISLDINSILPVTGRTWGSIASAVWSQNSYPNDRLTVTMGSGASLLVGDSIGIGYRTIRDVTNAITATGSPPAISGTFGGVVAPHLISAIANDPPAETPGPDSGDTVILRFDASTNAYAIAAAKIDGVLRLAGGTHTWGTIVSAGWSSWMATNDTLTVTLGTGATIGVGDTITIASGTIKDSGGTVNAVGSPPEISGDFGVAAITVSTVSAADPFPVAAGAGAGDTITLTFSQSTNGYEIDSGNIGTVLVLSGANPAGPTWGTISSADWSDNYKTLTVTLNAGPTMGASGDGGDTAISIAAGTIKDASGTNDCTAGPFSITGSFGTAPVPVLRTALAEDYTAGGPGVQDGDRVVFTFDSPTDGDTTGIATMVPLSVGAWGGLQNPPNAGGNQQWLDGNRILVVYLDSADCTIVPATSQAQDNPGASGRNQYIESAAGTNPGISAPTTDDSTGWPITIAGTFGPGVTGYYYDDPDTPTGVTTPTLRLLVNGASQGTTSSAVSGAYSFSVLILPGDRLIVYKDAAATPYASAVTVNGVGDSVTDLLLYSDYVTVRNHAAGTTATSDINTAKGAYADADMRFSIAGSTLSILSTAAPQTLYVMNHFTPGGAITFNSNRLRLGNGTFTNGAYANAPATLQVDNGTFTFGNVGATATTVTVAGTVTMSNGAINLGSGTAARTLRVDGAYTQSGGTLILADAIETIDFNYSVTFSGSAATVISAGLITCAGDWDDSAASGAMSPSGGTVRFDGVFPTSWTNHVVISEVQIAGDGGADDEFIELYNPTSSAVTLTGWKIELYDSTGGSTGDLVSSFPATTIAAYSYVLVASPAYNGGASDVSYSSGFRMSSNNSVRFVNASAVYVDGVAWGSATGGGREGGSAYPINPPSEQSMERKPIASTQGNGVDSDNNNSDFGAASPSAPQSSASAGEEPIGAIQTIVQRQSPPAAGGPNSFYHLLISANTETIVRTLANGEASGGLAVNGDFTVSTGIFEAGQDRTHEIGGRLILGSTSAKFLFGAGGTGTTVNVHSTNDSGASAALTVTGGVLSMGLAGDVMTVDGGVTMSAQPVISNGRIDVAKGWDDSTSSGFVPTGGKVRFNGSSAGTWLIKQRTAASPSSFYDLEIAGTAGTVIYQPAVNGVFANGNLTVANDFTTSGSGVFDTGIGFTHTIGGRLIVSGGTFQFNTAGDCTVNVNSTYDAGIGGALAVSSGSLAMDSAGDTLDVAGGAKFTGGGVTISGGEIRVADSWDDSGASGGFTPTGGSVRFDGNPGTGWTNHVVISEIQVAGDGGAPADDEFVELYNPTSAAVTLTGWKIMLYDGANTYQGDLVTSFPVTTIAAFSYVLVAPGEYNGATARDVAYDTAFRMANSNSIRLRDSLAQTVDGVGWGNVSGGGTELTSVFGNPASNGSIYRAPSHFEGGGIDTGDNSSDFAFASPSIPQAISSGSQEPPGAVQTILQRTSPPAAGGPNNFHHLVVNANRETLVIPNTNANAIGNLTIGGDLTITSGKFETGQDRTHGVSGRLVLNGTNGRLLFTGSGAGSAVNVNSSNDSGGSAALTLAGGALTMGLAGDVLAVAGGVTVSSGTPGAGVTSGRIDVAKGWDDSGASGGWTPAGGTVRFNGGTVATYAIKQRTAATRNRFYHLTIDPSVAATYQVVEVVTTATYPSGAPFQVLGNMAVSVGIFDAENAAADDPFVSIGGTLTISAGALFDAEGDIATIAVAGSTTVGGELRIPDGTFDADGIFDATGGTVTFLAAGTGTLKLGAAVTSLGTFTAGNGTVIYDATTAQTVDAVTYYNLSLTKGTSAAAADRTATAGAGFTISNNLTIAENGGFDTIFAIGANTVVVTGATSCPGEVKIGTGKFDANGSFDATGGAVTFTAAGELELSGAVTSLGTLDVGASPTALVRYNNTTTDVTVQAAWYGRLILDPGAGRTLTAFAGGTVQTQDTLTVNSGRFLIPDTGNVMVDGDGAGTADLIVSAGATLEMNGGATGSTLAMEDTTILRLSGTFLANTGPVYPKVTSYSPGVSRYEFNVESGGLVTIGGMILESPYTSANRGLHLKPGAQTVGLDIDNVTFDAPEGTGAFLYLELGGAVSTDFAFGGCTFNGAPQYTVRTNATWTAGKRVIMIGAVNGGPATENDRDSGTVTPGSIVWGLQTIWTGGAATTSWNTPGNWDNGIPDFQTDAIIPTAAWNPILDGAGGACAKLDVTTGAFTIGSALTLDVYGDISNTGTITMTNGAIRATGGALQQTLTLGASAMYNLTIDKTAGIVVPGSDLTIANALTITSGEMSYAAMGASPRSVGCNTFTLQTGGAFTFGAGSAARTLTATTFTMTGGTILIDDANETLTANGNVTISGGTVTMSAGTIVCGGHWDDTLGDGAFVPTGGVVRITGGTTHNVSQRSALTANTFYNLEVDNGLVTVVPLTALTVTNRLRLLVGASSIFDTGVGLTHTIGTQLLIEGGTFRFATTGDATVNVDGTGDAGDAIPALKIAGGALSMDSAGDLLSVDGGVLIASGSEAVTGGEIAVAKGWDDSGGSGAWTPTGGTVRFNGSVTPGTYAIKQRTAATRNEFNNLTIAGASISYIYQIQEVVTDAEYPTGFPFRVAGALTVSGGQFDLENAAADDPYVTVVGAVSVSAATTLDGTANASTFRVGGDWSTCGTWNPGSMTVGFNGAGVQNIASSSSTSTELVNTADNGGDITVADTSTFAPGGGTAYVGGDDFTYTGKSVPSGAGGLLGIAGVSGVTASGTSVRGTNTFSNLEVGIDTTTPTVVLGNHTTVTATASSLVSEGTLRLNGFTLTLSGTGAAPGNTVLSGGALQLDAGSTLALASGATLTVSAGGTIRTSGTTSSTRATITRSGSSGTYDFVVNGTLGLDYYRVRYCGANGMQVGAGALDIDGLGDGNFDGLANGDFDFPVAGNALLNFTGYDGASPAGVYGCRFGNSVGMANAKGVKGTVVGAAGILTFFGWSGAIGGPDFEIDASNKVDWATTVYSVLSGGTVVEQYVGVAAALANATAANNIVESRGSGIEDLGGASIAFPNQAGIILRNAFLANGSLQGSGGGAGNRGTLRNCFVAFAALGQSIGGTAALDSVDNCTVVEEVDDAITRITAGTVRNTAYTGAAGEISGAQTTCATGVVAATVFSDATRRDYHLKPAASSLIDQGTNLGFAPADDIDGNTRGIDDALTADGGDLSRWDIGADEYGAVLVGGAPGSIPAWSSASAPGGVLMGALDSPMDYSWWMGLLYGGTTTGGAALNDSFVMLNPMNGTVAYSLDLPGALGVSNAHTRAVPSTLRLSSGTPTQDLFAVSVDTDNPADGISDKLLCLLATEFRTGTVSVTNASAIVTGTGTAWQTSSPAAAANDKFVGPDNVTYTVGSVDSDTQITLTTAYGGATIAGASYRIGRLALYTGFSGNGVLDSTDGANALYQPVGQATFAGDGTDNFLWIPAATAVGGTSYFCKYTLAGVRVWANSTHAADFRPPSFFNRIMNKCYIALTNDGNGWDWGSVDKNGAGALQGSMGAATVNRFPSIWVSPGSATSWLFLAPETNSAYAVQGATGTSAWVSPDLNGLPTTQCMNPSFYTWVYLGVDQHICKLHRITGALATDGDAPGEDWSTTDWLRGSISTNYVNWNSRLFCGTESGYCYQISVFNNETGGNDGQSGITSGFPYRIPGTRIVGVSISLSPNRVYYSCEDGRILAFVIP
ncbi:MAG: lamin tail domain-containing protein [Planctomycetes bacterium]|nr:lamin tail domain-containing protein [Planctomycetota bacterium]